MAIKRKTTKKNLDYTYVETNIYKTGDRYRVRVKGQGCYTTSLTAARKAKSTLRKNLTSTRIW